MLRGQLPGKDLAVAQTWQPERAAVLTTSGRATRSPCKAKRLAVNGAHSGQPPPSRVGGVLPLRRALPALLDVALLPLDRLPRAAPCQRGAQAGGAARRGEWACGALARRAGGRRHPGELDSLHQALLEAPQPLLPPPRPATRGHARRAGGRGARGRRGGPARARWSWRGGTRRVRLVREEGRDVSS
jgi:hypothetical protein